MAPRNDASARALQDSVDRLADAFDRMAGRLEAMEGGAVAAAGGDKVTRHIRRYMPFYALATVWALMLLILPTRQDDGAQSSRQASALTPGASQTYEDGGALPLDGSDLGTSSARGGRGGGGSSAPVAGQSAAGASTSGANVPTFTGTVDTLAWNEVGKTRAGFDCRNGVRQMPWSKYAVPCYPAWTKGNGGATSPGVTAKEITIVVRRFPESANSRAVEAAREAAGFASTDVAREVSNTWMKYFNKVYELWGRQVKWIIYESQYGNSTDEAQSKGKEGACADADHIKATFKAFGIVSGSNVFAECAAERGMVTFAGGAYFPERWYDRLHPYAWHTVTDCERISNQVAEYIGKRLAGRPAKWAKQTEKGRTRKFATYVPDNDEYQYCVNITEKKLKEDYNVSPGSRYNYVLDVSRFPDEAARAAIQFKADMTTTLIMACDPISMIFLTQAAKGQQWWPEWFNIGVAANDTDNYPRLWDQDEIRGSLFGMSQLGATHKLFGPKAEPAVTYRRATGTNIPEGTTGNPTYYTMMHVMNALQAAGPNLTPKTMADAIQKLPPGGAPDYPIGLVSFRDGPDGTRGATDHTAIEDSREIWWDHEGTGYDGEQGTYVETYGGKRFNNGQWPREEPPVFRK